MPAHAVKNSGQWCPRCGIKRRSDAQRLTTEDMRVLAESRGGKFLSAVSDLSLPDGNNQYAEQPGDKAHRPARLLCAGNGLCKHASAGKELPFITDSAARTMAKKN